MVDEASRPAGGQHSCQASGPAPEQQRGLELLAGLAEEDAAEVTRRLPGVYRELRAAAASCLKSFSKNQTCVPTDLVHEAWLKLRRAAQVQEWTSDGHFVTAAAIAMRQIVIDRIRARRRHKRGGARQQVSLEACESPLPAGPDADERAEQIHDLLGELARRHPRCARLVEVRFFLGLTEAQCADALGVSVRTVRRDWVLARSWLARALDGRRIRGDF